MHETIEQKLMKIQSKYPHLMDRGNILSHISWRTVHQDGKYSSYLHVSGLPPEVEKEIHDAYWPVNLEEKK